MRQLARLASGVVVAAAVIFLYALVVTRGAIL
jgi:hypothetical protein